MSFRKPFTTFDRDKKVLGTFKTLSNALASKPYVVTDDEGLQYFSDGTGTGFSSIKESNAGLMFENHKGIYNQKKKSIESVRAVSWHVWWETKSLKAVRSYHERIRKLIASNELKIAKGGKHGFLT